MGQAVILVTVEKAQAKIIRALERQVKAHETLLGFYRLQRRGSPGHSLDEIIAAKGAERAARHALKEAT